jgi:rhodanese-related sulfurtransferase
MLAEARSRIVRYTPAEAVAADDILLVDVRSADERDPSGAIPGSVHVPRSVLEGRGVDAGDLDGGFDAWVPAGLPVAR